jgi:hypothetical protein
MAKNSKSPRLSAQDVKNFKINVVHTVLCADVSKLSETGKKLWRDEIDAAERLSDEARYEAFMNIAQKHGLPIPLIPGGSE